MDPTTIFDLIAQRKVVPLMGLAIYMLVRLVKNDIKFFPSMPGKVRFWLALVLGAVGGAVDKALLANANVSWTQAMSEGLIAAGLAIFFHLAVVDSLREGRELPVPGLTIPGARPEANKPTTIPPGPSALWLWLGVGGLTYVLATANVACGYGGTACKVIDVAHEQCTWLRYLEADGTVKEVPVTQDEAREFGRALAAKKAADGGAK